MASLAGNVSIAFTADAKAFTAAALTLATPSPHIATQKGVTSCKRASSSATAEAAERRSRQSRRREGRAHPRTHEQMTAKRSTAPLHRAPAAAAAASNGVRGAPPPPPPPPPPLPPLESSDGHQPTSSKVAAVLAPPPPSSSSPAAANATLTRRRRHVRRRHVASRASSARTHRPASKCDQPDPPSAQSPSHRHPLGGVEVLAPPAASPAVSAGRHGAPGCSLSWFSRHVSHATSATVVGLGLGLGLGSSPAAASSEGAVKNTDWSIFEDPSNSSIGGSKRDPAPRRKPLASIFSSSSLQNGGGDGEAGGSFEAGPSTRSPSARSSSTQNAAAPSHSSRTIASISLGNAALTSAATPSASRVSNPVVNKKTTSVSQSSHSPHKQR